MQGFIRMIVVVVVALAACRHGPPAVAWQPPVELARGGGEKGPWQQNDSQFDYVDDPSTAIAPDGSVAVVWVDQAKSDVLFQILSPNNQKRFAQPINVSRTPDVFSWLPRVALSPRRPHDIYVLWQEIVFSGGPHGGEIFFARSQDDGATFEAPQNLTRSIYGEGKGRLEFDKWDNGSLDFVVGDRGELYAAWTAWDGQLWLARSFDAGATFEAPKMVENAPGRPARAPSLAVKGEVVYLAWTTGEDRAADVRVAVSRDGGTTFDEPVVVEETPRYSDAPDVAVDATGMVHVVFGDEKHIRYARSRDSGASFEPSRVISARQRAGFPTLVLDGERVNVVWDLFSKDDSPHGLGFTRSNDGGGSFTDPVEVPGTRDPGTNGSQQGRLTHKLAVRGHAIVVVNSALRRGELSRVWLVRGTS